MRRLTIAFIAALMLAVPATIWLGRRVAGARAATPAERRSVVAARGNLDAGEALKPGDVMLTAWPVSDALPGAFTKPEEIAGRTVLYPLAAGEPILERDLAAAGAGTGLSGKIPAGMRAIALKSDEIVGVAGFLFPGTRMDALVTYHQDNRAEPVTSIVLQDVQILAAGHQIQPDPEGKSVSVDVVTLLLTPHDAAKAVLASSQGAIHFVLRNGGDRGQTSDAPVGLAELGGGSSHAAVTRMVEPGLRVAAKPYVVETILGAKQTTDSFQ